MWVDFGQLQAGFGRYRSAFDQLRAVFYKMCRPSLFVSAAETVNSFVSELVLDLFGFGQSGPDFELMGAMLVDLGVISAIVWLTLALSTEHRSLSANFGPGSTLRQIRPNLCVVWSGPFG